MENTEEINNALLESAKKTLEKLPFFALTEYDVPSQKLFEKTIGNDVFKFQKYSAQTKKESLAQKHMKRMDEKDIKMVQDKNHLDIKLYAFAKKLFLERLSFYNIKIDEK